MKLYNKLVPVSCPFPDRSWVVFNAKNMTKVLFGRTLKLCKKFTSYALWRHCQVLIIVIIIIIIIIIIIARHVVLPQEPFLVIKNCTQMRQRF